jgi:restriction endonuclease S subunit
MLKSQILSFPSLSRSSRFDSEFFYEPHLTTETALNRYGSKPLSEYISEAHRGVGPKYDPEGIVPVVRSVNVRNFEVSQTRIEYVSESFAQANSQALIPHFSLFVTSTGVGTIGRVFMNLYGKRMFADGHITILAPTNRMKAAFLCAFLQTPIGRQQLIRRHRGSSRQIEIYPDDILSVLIPNFPKDFEEMIADKWLQAVENVHGAKDNYPLAEKILTERVGCRKITQVSQELCFFRNIKQLTTRKRFDPEFYESRVSNVRSVLANKDSVTFGKLHHHLFNSYSKGIQPNRYVEDGNVVVIKSKDVKPSGIDLFSCDRTCQEAIPSDSEFLTEGKLLINMTGQGTLGRAAVVPDLDELTVASVDVAIFSLDTTICVPEYVSLFLNSQLGQIQSIASQTGSSGQQHLYPELINEILIFLPFGKDGNIDLDWQRHLAKLINERYHALRCAGEALQEIVMMTETELNHRAVESETIPI